MADPMSVTLVIPGRNCAATLDKCLASVVPLLESGQLEKIIFVDDGSTDETAKIAERYPVTVIQGIGRGPGAARNLGWQSTDSELIWFIDSDCVAAPDALSRLLPHVDVSDRVAGAGGSYANLFPKNQLASLIHEEIVARHRRMGSEVNFLATFNVLYRREVLEKVRGFDESLKLAQDAELAYRISAAGYRLRFELDSRVGHHHPRSWRRYLKTQCRQGFYRMRLYRSHPKMVSGDSYAGLVDYAQPPLACMAWLVAAISIIWPTAWMGVVLLSGLLLLLQLPMTWQCIKSLGLRGLSFTLLGFVRSHVRAVGMVAGVIARADAVPSGVSRIRKPTGDVDASSLSIILPTRDRSHKLLKCLDSLRDQTAHGFQVVVVNDGSDDDTRDRLDGYLDNSLDGESPFTLVVIHNDQPRGANASRNLALQKCIGKWIVMLDDDCFADPAWIENLLLIRNQHDAVAVTGHVENVALSNPWERFFVGQHRVTSKLLDGRPIARRLVAGNALVARDWLDGSLDEDRSSVSADMATSGRGDEEGLRLRLLAAGECILHAPEAIVFHDHPYAFRSFLRQAYKSGRSTARLAIKYRQSPRWELICFLVTALAILVAGFYRPSIWLAGLAGSLFLAAAIYNELFLKRREWWAVLLALPVLLIYFACRSMGYAFEFLCQGFMTKRTRQWLGRRGFVRRVHRWREGRRLFGDNSQWRQYENDWYQSRTPSRSAIQDQRPWLTYPAIDWLEQWPLENAKVFEWGCGGSTLYFLNRDATVTSVEHVSDWADAVQSKAREIKRDRLEIRCRSLPDSEQAVSSPEISKPTISSPTASSYESAIEDYADDSFDLILIDGRRRIACLRSAIPKVAPGGVIILDNADRERYSQVVNKLSGSELANWSELRFPGPTPYFWDSMSETCIWMRPQNNGQPGVETQQQNESLVR